MAGPLTQSLAVPDVGAGPGPFPAGAWTAGTINTLTRVGLQANATAADIVVVLCSAIGGADPILPPPTNPNLLGSFVGPGMVSADTLHATSCCFYACIRYKPASGVPTVGLTVQLVGT